MRAPALWIGAALFALLAAAGGLGGSGLYLELVSYPDARVLFRTGVEKGFPFSTLIRHSVHLTPVYENYRVADAGAIVLESTRFQDLGWGVPSTFGEPYRVEDGFMVITGINRTMGSLPFRVSRINNPELLLGPHPGGAGGEPLRILLADHVRDGKRVTITVRRENGFTRLARMFF